jgi:lysophospholipase L1-like esterase
MSTIFPTSDHTTTPTSEQTPRRLSRGVRLLAMTGVSAALMLSPTLTSVASAQAIPDASTTTTTGGKDNPAKLPVEEQDAADEQSPGDEHGEETPTTPAPVDDSAAEERSTRESVPGNTADDDIVVDEDNVDSWWDKIMGWLTGDDEEDDNNAPAVHDDEAAAQDDDSTQADGSNGAGAMKQTVRIQTLGDSIIDNDLGGARPALQEKFADVGVTVDWVGTSNESGPASLTSPATDAHTGKSIADMLPDTAAWVKAANPDVIMVSAGGNDMMHDQGAGIEDRWTKYLTTICQAAPGVPIVAATNHQLKTSTKAAENELMTKVLNPVIEASDGTSVEGGCPVTVVDMNGVISDDELLDDLHPNKDGYADMAEEWFPALRTAINELPFTDAADTEDAKTEEIQPASTASTTD